MFSPIHEQTGTNTMATTSPCKTKQQQKKELGHSIAGLSVPGIQSGISRAGDHKD